MKEILKAEGLTKFFESGQRAADAAVDSVSFQILEGETLGLVGGSGCGKSTLARLITRLIDPSAGTIRLNGIDITKAKGKALREAYRQMQMVFQSPMASFDPRRPIGYGIGEALKNSGVPKAERKQRVAGLLEQCDLSPAYARRYPHELSGGQCQRAAIARALAVRPRLLICDEATSSLDVMAQHQIVELLLKNKGAALDRNKILTEIWGENYYSDVKIVDVNIRRLRIKVEDEPSAPVYIQTVWGYGYKWGEQ